MDIQDTREFERMLFLSVMERLRLPDAISQVVEVFDGRVWRFTRSDGSSFDLDPNQITAAFDMGMPLAPAVKLALAERIVQQLLTRPHAPRAPFRIMPRPETAAVITQQGGVAVDWEGTGMSLAVVVMRDQYQLAGPDDLPNGGAIGTREFMLRMIREEARQPIALHQVDPSGVFCVVSLEPLFLAPTVLIPERIAEIELAVRGKPVITAPCFGSLLVAPAGHEYAQTRMRSVCEGILEHGRIALTNRMFTPRVTGTKQLKGADPILIEPLWYRVN